MVLFDFCERIISIMSYNQDFDDLIHKDEEEPLEADVGSVQNNCDNGQDRQQEIDMLGDNYENNYEKTHGLNLSKEISVIVDNKKDVYDKNTIEYRLTNNEYYEDYDDALTEYTSTVGIYTGARLATILKIILECRKFIHNEAMQLSRNLIFLKQLCSQLKSIQHVDTYRQGLEQLLKPAHYFYSYNFNEQSLQILNIYLEEENPDFTSIHQTINEYFQSEMPLSLTDPQPHLYRYIHHMAMVSCLRQGKFAFNLFLLTRALQEDQRDLLSEYEESTVLRDYGLLQRKQLEEYLQMLVLFCKNKEHLLQKYVFGVVHWLLHESQQMEKKLLGFRVINELIVDSKIREQYKYILVNWLKQNKIVEVFMRDSTHSRILQQIQPIIHFLYESQVLQDGEIIEIMKMSLHSEQIFKVVQGMLSWLKLKHLFLVFQIIPYHTDRQSSLFIGFINSLLANPLVSDENSRKRKTVIIQDNRKQTQCEIPEHQMEIEQDYSESIQHYVRKLLHLLIELVVQHQNNYMPILLRLISAHSRLFKDQLELEVIKLFRSGSVCALWIIEHWLKIETARDRGQGKYELITKLTSQGVYQFMLALLARNRFSRLVVEKALAVIIIFCRFNRPLEKTITEFLWKVLGTTARDEREREQFFVFLKQLVRYEGSITQQSVNFIFFDILMSLVAGWFSLRVYDCLQMLFLRLNEDCKLINFERDQYKIVKEPLIGTDKFIYIYFNCVDLKVVKKCKDFLCKLIVNSEETKEAMYNYMILHLKKYMTYAIQMAKSEEGNKRQVIILRIMDIAEKLSLQKEKVEEVKENTINLHLQVSSMYTLGARNSTMEFNENITLSDLRCYIGDNLNPPIKNIELWTKGKLLKGQNLTLKELKLENNQTISVTKAQDMEPQEDKAQKRKEQLQLLTSLLGQDYDQQFLNYVIIKFEGESTQTIANDLFDADRAKALMQEFKEKKFQKEEVIIEVENIKEKAKNFGTLLVHQRDIFEMLLQCLRISQNKSAGWNFIKKLPLNEAYAFFTNEQVQAANWQKLFTQKITQQEIYIIHILFNYLKQHPEEVKEIFERKGLRKYLISWLSQIVSEKPEELANYEDLLKLLFVEIDCPVITLFDEFINHKQINEKDYQIIPFYEDAISKRRHRWDFGLGAESTAKIIDCLVSYNVYHRVANLIAKLYLLQLIYPSDQNKYYSVLAHPKLGLLMLRYGKPLQFMVIATALHLNTENNQHFLPKFTFKLFAAFRKQPHDKQNKHCYSSFFSCLNQLLMISAVFDSNEELQILTQLLEQIQEKVAEFEEEEIIGYFKICQTLLERHLKTDHGGKRKNEDIFSFANWLFNKYLFGVSNYPFFTSKPLRKAAYQLLIKMCSSEAVAKSIAQSVRHLMKGFQDSNEVEGQIRTSSQEFIGMKNLGATCYINSLIQQLYHTVLPKLLLEDDNEPSTQPIKLLQLKKIFVNLYCGIRSPVHPNDFIDTVKINGEYVRPMVQQDVNEFFASLMHDVEQAVGVRAINQTLCGTLCHQIRGLQEGSEVKNVDETFLTLMIDIKYKRTLLEGLTSLSKPHFLEGENMYYSQVLHKKIRASSRTYLGKLPNILAITLKRFYWNFQQMNRIKINDYFEFPLELDLSRYAMQGRKESDPHYFDYKLCGIIIHSGSAESGHYYSFIKVGDKWLEFNDRKVSEWDIHNNLKSECFGNDQKSKNAYMLFYERVNSQAHGCSIDKLPKSNRLLELIQKENENFVLNRLIYDSNYINFIKELSQFERYKSILSVLDSLKHYRHTPEVYFQKPEQAMVAEEPKVQQNKEKAEISQMVDENQERQAQRESQPRHVTQDEVNQLVERYYPGNVQEVQAAKQNEGTQLLDQN